MLILNEWFVVDGYNDIRRVDLSTIDIICSDEIFGFIVMAGWFLGIVVFGLFLML
jgi:hypothetical protein